MKSTLSGPLDQQTSKEREKTKIKSQQSAMCNFKLVPFLRPSIYLIIRWAPKRGLFIEIFPLVGLPEGWC